MDNSDQSNLDSMDHVTKKMVDDLEKGVASIVTLSDISPDMVSGSGIGVSTQSPKGSIARDETDNTGSTEKEISNDNDDKNDCDISILSYESIATPLLPITKRGQILCVVAVTLLLVISVTLAGVCGLGYCGRQSDSQSKLSGVDFAGCMSPEVAPTTGPMNGTIDIPYPSMSPITRTSEPFVSLYKPPQKAFTTTQELYDAVDEYLESGYANSIYGHPIGEWNISLLTNLSNVFNAYNRNPAAYFFNEDLSGWDTSNVVTMENMFLDARTFNGDISTWQTRRVISMYQMFGRATSFNGDISQWDVSSVTTIERMFALVTNFDNDLRGWNVSAVTNMRYTFLNCFSFRGRGLDTWDTGNVQTMEGMFLNTPSFNGDISLWNVSQVTSTRRQFRQATSFNSDLSNWDVRNVTNMSEMFMHAVSFNADISEWDVSSVTDASRMFYGATSFKTDLSNWNVSSMVDVTKMFAAAKYQNYNYCSWEQRLPENAMTTSLFIASGCPNQLDPYLDVSSKRISYCTDCENLINATTSPSSSPVVNTTLPPVVNTTLPPQSASFEAIRDRDELLDAVDLYLNSSSTPFSDVTLRYGYPIGRWDVSQVTNFSGIFNSDRNSLCMLFNEDLIGWDTSAAQTMEYMFMGATNFNGNISTWSTSRVTNMTSMFFGADQFNGDLSLWDTSAVRDMSSMFHSALLFEGKGLFRWNTSSVRNMAAMFDEAVSFVGNISTWDISNVMDIRAIFQYASSFNGNISAWDVSNVELFSYAFSGASSFNRDLSMWNVSSATELIGMFSSAKAFNKNLCTWGQLLNASAAPTGNLTRGMFTNSACLDTRDPNITNLSSGPFCSDCTV